VSTAIRLLLKASSLALASAPTIEEAEQLRALHTVTFIDGMPRSADDVQTLYDARLTTPHEGGIVRVTADRYLLPDVSFYTTLPLIESRIRALQIPYFVVHNDELDVAVGDLARRAGISR
jgi:hypothetical protein